MTTINGNGSLFSALADFAAKYSSQPGANDTSLPVAAARCYSILRTEVGETWADWYKDEGMRGETNPCESCQKEDAERRDVYDKAARAVESYCTTVVNTIGQAADLTDSDRAEIGDFISALTAKDLQHLATGVDLYLVSTFYPEATKRYKARVHDALDAAGVPQVDLMIRASSYMNTEKAAYKQTLGDLLREKQLTETDARAL